MLNTLTTHAAASLLLGVQQALLRARLQRDRGEVQLGGKHATDGQICDREKISGAIGNVVQPKFMRKSAPGRDTRAPEAAEHAFWKACVRR